MTVRSTFLALIGGCFAVLWGAPAVADEIRVSGGDCAGTVRLVARDARLSAVLKRLAQALDFQVSFESDSDPLINVSATREPVDLVGLLAPSENVSLTQARNPPNRERIVKVWVLPKGQKNFVRAAMAPQPPDASVAEQARKEREGAEMILKSHGIPTPQPEEQNPENPENPENSENPH